MAKQHTFITPDTDMVDSGTYYSATLDLSDYRTMAFDIEVRSLTGGTCTVAFERQVKEGGEFTPLHTTGALSAAGHTHGQLNAFAVEADVLGRMRVKPLLKYRFLTTEVMPPSMHNTAFAVPML